MLFDSHSRDWRWPLSPSSRLLTVCLWSKTGTFSRNKREVLCELWCVASKIEGKECISASLEKVSINFVNTPTGWIINFFGLLLSPPSYLMKGGEEWTVWRVCLKTGEVVWRLLNLILLLRLLWSICCAKSCFFVLHPLREKGEEG